jgi:NAD(P) transhydrogenase subunit alpha
MVFPAKVFVVGAAVAGLQAIATARRLGANVLATDVRPEVKEQIESVGAKYVGIELKESAAAGGGYAKELSQEDRDRQRQLLAEQCAQSDVVITTALIGGVFAPKLLTAAMVESMKPGSIIVDLAADGGGNCELSRPGETVSVNGVTIMAPLNLPASMPNHASLLFSRNLTAFIQAFTKDKAFQLDFNDDIQQGALITHEGEVRNARSGTSRPRLLVDALRVRPGLVHRAGSDPSSVAIAPYAADVDHQRHLRHRRRGLDHRGRR